MQHGILAISEVLSPSNALIHFFSQKNPKQTKKNLKQNSPKPHRQLTKPHLGATQINSSPTNPYGFPVSQDHTKLLGELVLSLGCFTVQTVLSTPIQNTFLVNWELPISLDSKAIYTYSETLHVIAYFFQTQAKTYTVMSTSSVRTEYSSSISVLAS